MPVQGKKQNSDKEQVSIYVVRGIRVSLDWWHRKKLFDLIIQFDMQ